MAAFVFFHLISSLSQHRAGVLQQFPKMDVMKQFILLTILALPVLKVVCQQPTEGKVEYDKKQIPAAVVELPYAPAVVEDAMKDYLYRKGVKGGSAKGFTYFKGTKVAEGLNNKDVYFKVEKKSHKEKNASIVYLFATDENADPASADEYNFDVTASKQLLEEMLPAVQTNELAVEIGGQESSLRKAEKKYESLEDERRSIEKKIKKLQDDLVENGRNLERQKQEVENQKRIIGNLKDKKL